MGSLWKWTCPPRVRAAATRTSRERLDPLRFQNPFSLRSLRMRRDVWARLLIAALPRCRCAESHPAVPPWGTGQTHHRVVTNVQGEQGRSHRVWVRGREPTATGMGAESAGR